MMHDDILISVVMPAYNASAYIGEAIRSVLYQTWEKSDTPREPVSRKIRGHISL